MSRLEAYEVRRLVRPRDGLLRGIADDEDRAGPIGSAAQRPEHVAGAAVDADPADALEPECLLETGHLAQLAGRRDEEADAGAADACLRRDLLPADRLAERGRDRHVVQVDAQRCAAQLRVVAAAESSGEL